MMDPKDPQRLFSNRTLWLDAESMEVARDRFWKAWLSRTEHAPEGWHHEVWNIAWAAGISAYLYMAEGNLGPDPQQ
jgi:hypothetical protein